LKRIISFILALALLTGACSFPSAPVVHTGGELTVYYIDVGQGDATLLVCGGEVMLIDGGNPSDSDLIYAFLKDKGITHIDYMIATHPHADHAGGLSGALHAASAGTVFSPVTEYDTRAFGNFVRILGERGIGITVPSPGDRFGLGEAEVMILGPAAVDPGDMNNSSICLKVTHGAVSFLFTGDAERRAEQALLDAGYDLSATVLKVGHHGSDTSTIYPFLRAVMPEYAVISCGRGNSYGHPHDNVLSRLRDADVALFRTDMQGDIIFVSDGAAVTVRTERNSGARTNPTEPSVDADEVFYIGNSSSLKFHRPSCSSLPADHNRVMLDSRDEALGKGFDPCGSCRP
jgi:competence protein ComEC